jgi:hypothetical protein
VLKKIGKLKCCPINIKGQLPILTSIPFNSNKTHRKLWVIMKNPPGYPLKSADMILPYRTVIKRVQDSIKEA